MRNFTRIGVSLGMAACVAALFGASACAVEPRSDPSLQTPAWKLAVVFRREKGRRVYVGTAAVPAVPPIACDPARDNEPAGDSTLPRRLDYEIWLAGDGILRGLWYSSNRHVWGDLPVSGNRRPAYRDDGSLKRLVHRAKPAGRQPELPPGASGSALYPSLPDKLKDLSLFSDVIAVGRVVGVLRNAFTPFGRRNDWLQHTVFAVAVEQYLKTDAGGIRPLLKLWNEGGWLPWARPDGARGIGDEVQEDPLPRVGERYLLFLKLPDDPGGEHRARGYVAYRNIPGLAGKVAELDEYIAVDHWQGKLLLRNGVTRAPATLRQPGLDHWRFEQGGPQILDVPEGVALRAIRQTLTQLQGR